MKLTELRIGNWVMQTEFPDRKMSVQEIKKNGVSCQYKGQQNTEIAGIRSSYFGYESIQPIPLTLEIIDKTLFRENGIWCYKHRVFLDKVNETEWEVRMIFHPNLNGMVTPVKYLHQLQNIYFSLTQEELIINF